MMHRSRLIALCALALLSACGVRRDIKPQAGHNFPVAPYGRTTKPTAAELLAPSSQTQPGRSVELRSRSETRTDDPFDLPPKE